jgi:transcriptional regulator with XRE-family HTH domain
MNSRFEFIREFRKKNKLTLEQLSEKANVSKDFIARLERGDRDDAPLKKIDDILSAMDLKLGDIFPQSEYDDDLNDLIIMLQSLSADKRADNIKLFKSILEIEDKKY